VSSRALWVESKRYADKLRAPLATASFIGLLGRQTGTP
jgi:hypothetical protein